MQWSSNYNVLDRALHYVAFSAPFVQRALEDLENDLFGRALRTARSRDEVFITGLPRAGTTLLLESLHGTGEFGSFTYRHMPFILAPMIWHKIASAQRRRGGAVQRAHGDGMPLSFDSPEAFEEVVWLAHLRKRFVRERTLVPLSKDMISTEFTDALRLWIRKVLTLAARPGAPWPRYLSKNNANLSRIGVLTELFPTSTILVAFRDPEAHVGSLSVQHDRFSRAHVDDRFSRRYMAWLGHYEFGANFRPIDFSGWLGEAPVPREPDDDFWFRYWSAAYAYALEQRTENVRFVDFDELVRNGAPYLERLGEAVGVRRIDALVRAAGALRARTSKPIDAGACRPPTRQAAREIHARLRAAAL